MVVVEFSVLATITDFKSQTSKSSLRRPSEWCPSSDHVSCCVQLLSCIDHFATPLEPARLLCPWDSPGKNTRVGCHFLPRAPPASPNIYIMYVCIWKCVGSDYKESAWNAGDPGLIPGSGRFPWRREWRPNPVFLPGEFHGQRSLTGYSPWGSQSQTRLST